MIVIQLNAILRVPCQAAQGLLGDHNSTLCFQRDWLLKPR